jgi:hypothetical protein
MIITVIITIIIQTRLRAAAVRACCLWLTSTIDLLGRGGGYAYGSRPVGWLQGTAGKEGGGKIGIREFADMKTVRIAKVPATSAKL